MLAADNSYLLRSSKAPDFCSGGRAVGVVPGPLPTEDIHLSIGYWMSTPIRQSTLLAAIRRSARQVGQIQFLQAFSIPKDPSQAATLPHHTAATLVLIRVWRVANRQGTANDKQIAAFGLRPPGRQAPTTLAWPRRAE
jgi:hypothetical protein